MRILPSAVPLAAALFLLASCAAQRGPSDAPRSPPPPTFDGPVPVTAAPPQYPRDALVRGVTGWVRLSFNIEPDGTVSDVTVADSQPVKVFDAAARRALERWTFDPADAGPAGYTIEFQIGAP